MILAKVVADSKNEFGDRITTMIVTFPRIILAEFNTHRMFSRNSASSRAIPFEKMVKSIKENPFVPIAWMKDHRGMQGTEFFTNEDEIRELKSQYLFARDYAVQQAETLNGKGLTKQIVNRGLEAYMWHTVIVTATEWENFFALRCPQYSINEPNKEVSGKLFRSWKDVIKAITSYDLRNHDYDFYSKFDNTKKLKHNKGQAEIHMMALAEAMWDAYNESTPKELKAGEWHIPFGDNLDEFQVYKQFSLGTINEWGIKSFRTELDILKIKIATARCARVSYTVVGEEGKEPNYENDVKLHDRLAESGHWSPFEHCAKAMNFGEFDNSFHKGNSGDGPEFYSNGWSGNFRGFVQYRKMFNNENIS
ncbi:MAG: hypothetical protein ACK53T_07825 [Planctomycetota bacterium]|jgi:thymidylate synthase ThyX